MLGTVQSINYGVQVEYVQSVLGGIGADMAQAVLFGTSIPLMHVDGVDRSAIESTICAALVSRFEMMECCIDGGGCFDWCGCVCS